MMLDRNEDTTVTLTTSWYKSKSNITCHNRQTQKNRWDRQLLNQKEKFNKYQEEVQSKLQEIEEETDVNQDWQNLKQVILEAAKEF